MCAPRWLLDLVTPHTNNVAESANAKVKKFIDWRRMSILKFVPQIRLIVETQFKDIKKSFVGEGNYILHSGEFVNLLPRSINLSRNDWVDAVYNDFLNGVIDCCSDIKPVKHREPRSDESKGLEFKDGKWYVVSSCGRLSVLHL